MNLTEVIEQYYKRNTKACGILISHGELVAGKALTIARRVAHLNPNMQFIEEAARLHDIGMFLTRAPQLGCYGQHPYICHGYLGRELLESHGLAKHALVCERHVGVGITREDIKQQKLPVPQREMLPLTIEEQIICYADKFYSKNGGVAGSEKSVADVLKTLERYGQDKVLRFQKWVETFEG
jgi:uncharacterized protein